MQCNFIKKETQDRCFLVNFAKFLRTAFLQNTSGRLLLLKPFIVNIRRWMTSIFTSPRLSHCAVKILADFLFHLKHILMFHFYTLLMILFCITEISQQIGGDYSHSSSYYTNKKLKYLKFVSAIFYQIFIFSSSDRP